MMSTPSPSREINPTVEQHLPLVRKVAKKIARRLPSVVDLDDLISAGTLGLLDAASRFDPERIDSFAPYAEIRIRGAILDHLRAMDWLPRSVRQSVRRDGATTAVISVEDVRDDGFEGFEVDAPGPSSGVERRERRARLAQAIAQLPLRDRQLLGLYYVEELTLKQIGTIFGVTESRVCQLHAHAVTRLREELMDDIDLG